MSGFGANVGEAAAAPRTEPFRSAVIDLASSEGLRSIVARLPPSAAQPLFEKKSADALLQVGPWLVRLSKAPEVEAVLAGLKNGLPWGYYIYSTFDIVSLRHSLRKLNLVRIPEAKNPVLFRYWDPRVMLVFLDVATPEQRAQVFELIERIEIAGTIFESESTKE